MPINIGNIFTTSTKFPGATQSTGSVNGGITTTSAFADFDYTEMFAAAVKEYKHKMKQGLNRLTDDDIAERVEKFRQKHMPPPDATEQEFADFYAALEKYKKSLYELARGESAEMLITSSAENTDTRGFLQSKLPSNPALSQQLQPESKA